MKRLKIKLATTVYYLIQFIKQAFLIPNGTCRFSPTCSQFAREAIIELPPHIAIYRILGRLMKCNPFGSSGYDPVIRNTNTKENK
jgi:putative membrane protein insertion efficiency factor